MRSLRDIVAGAAALLVCAAAAPAHAQQAAKAAPAPPAAPAVQRAASVITATEFAARLAVLSDDSMAGRKTGAPGNEAAARYLAAQMKRLGLRPAGDSGGYVQRFPLLFKRVDPAGMKLSLLDGAGEQALEYGKDYLVIPSAVEQVTGEVLFAGEAPATDFRLSGDASGAMVVFYLPGPPDRAWNQRAQKASAAAKAAGAAGVFLILDPSFPASMFPPMKAQMEREMIEMEDYPHIAITYAAGAAAAAASGGNLDDLRSRPADAELIRTGLRVSYRQPLITRGVAAPNVVGIIQGADRRLRDEYVVVSAHFDHVGTGRPNEKGDSIFNGADDNASGTVALLEMARAFRQKGARPARSLVFLAVSGEEQGLRGSAYWVSHPTVSTGSIVANVNLDMVARNSPDTLAVLGQELSTLGERVQAIVAAHPELGLAVPPGSPWPELRMDLIRMSDQLPFLQAGIPALFFNSGEHPDLHRVQDDFEHANPEKASRATRLAFLLSHAIASAPERPALTDAGRQLMKTKD